MQDDSLLSDLTKLLNGLQENQYIVIDREGIRLGRKQENGQINLSKNIIRPVYQDSDVQKYLPSTSLAQSPSKNPIKSFSEFGKERSLKAKKRLAEREKIALKTEEAIVARILWDLSYGEREELVIGQNATYKKKVAKSGNELWCEVYPAKHELAGKPKTGEWKFAVMDGKKYELHLGAGQKFGEVRL